MFALCPYGAPLAAAVRHRERQHHCLWPVQGGPDTNRSMWYENAIIYGVDVLRCADPNGNGMGDLSDLISLFDHLVEIGVTCTGLLARDPSGSEQTVTLDLDPRQAPRLSNGLEYILPVNRGEPSEIEEDGFRWFGNPA